MSCLPQFHNGAGKQFGRTANPHADSVARARRFDALDGIRRRIMVRKLITLVMISTGLALSACNTVKGVGEDIKSVGEAGDRAT